MESMGSQKLYPNGRVDERGTGQEGASLIFNTPMERNYSQKRPGYWQELFLKPLPRN